MALFTPARRNVPELLDREDNSLEEHLASLKDLQGFNRNWRGARIILDALARVVGIADCATVPGADTTKNHKPKTMNLTVLDVGTGSADIPRAIVAWGRERGPAARAIGLDLHPLNLRLARRETREEAAIALVRGNGLRLPFRDGSVDVAMCSLFLHHFTEPEAVRLLREFARVARRAVIVSDLRRSWLLYYGLKLLTKWTARSRLTKYDGPVSALRAFTVGEARALAREAGMVRYTVTRRPSFRWVLSMVK